MSVVLVPVASPLHDPKAVKAVWSKYLSLLKDVVDSVHEPLITKVEELKGLPEANAYVVAVLTGGSEELILELFRRFRKPLALVAHETQNSLAATLEVASEVRYEGGVAEVFLLREGIDAELSPFIRACKAVGELVGSKVLLIGESSPWLVYSVRHTQSLTNLLNLNLVKVGIDELIKLYEGADGNEALRIAEGVINESLGIEGISKDDVIKATKLYLALKELMNSLEVKLMSIRCFDLLKYGVTACLGLSLLNNEGYVAACEGDLPTLITMAVLKYLSNEPVFMGNIDWLSNNELLIAHCTVPTKLVKSFKLKTHFESGISVGIEGYLRRGEVVTIAKLDVIKGVLRVTEGVVENEGPVSPYVCRTQYLIRLGEGARKLIEEPLGNHYALVRGSLRRELSYVAKLLNLRFELIK